MTDHLLNDWITKWGPAFNECWIGPQNGRSFTCEPEFQYWVAAQPMKLMDEITATCALMCKELVAAWGAPGEPGDAVLIRSVILKLDEPSRKMLDWKREIASARFPSRREKLRPVIMGWAKKPFEIVEEFRLKLSEILRDSSRTGAQSVQITVQSLPMWEEFQAEFERVTNSLPESDTYATPEAVAQKNELDRLMARASKRQTKF